MYMETVSECELNCLELCINSLSSRLIELTTTTLSAGNYTIYDTTRSNNVVGYVEITSSLSTYIEISTTGRVEEESIYFSGPNNNLGRIIIKDIQHNGGSVTFTYYFDTSYYHTASVKGNDELISEEYTKGHIIFRFPHER